MAAMTYSATPNTSFTIRALIYAVCLLMLTSLFIPVKAQEDVTTKHDSGYEVSLYYFWSRHCPHCKEAKSFITHLSKNYPWLTVYSYDVVDSEVNQHRFLLMAKQLHQSANSVPAFIFCGQMLVGYDNEGTIGKDLEEKLLGCHQQKPVQKKQESFTIPGLGNVHYQDFSLPVFTLIIAALDAFNPCAFFVLFFLLSLMAHYRSRTRMLFIGGTFVFCSGLMYFLFMSAWLNLFLVTEQLMFITVAAGLIAISFGLINIKDYFFFKQGISLSLTDSARSKLFSRIRMLTHSENWITTLVATVILAIVANSYELLCTAGLPMVYTRILTLNELSTAQYYLYLLFYNAIYIIPLLAIVVLFTWTLGDRKLSEEEGRVLKLLSGSMMLGLGLILLLKPEWLNEMLVSIAVIGGAILFTSLVTLLQNFKT
ncbi:MAG: thioredoxin family protein [Methylococcaceae bacterium]|nr:thioredoxin family protein [Methylococcaceae bacterium]